MPELFSNSIGMTFVAIQPGRFAMGQEDGDWDERPVHDVVIDTPFHMATTPVTNAQYERFDPDHRKLRGERDLSKEDDESVVFVSWQDAVRFCEWLSKKENKPYRLPTEAEWEYACRAGTATAFNTGDELPEPYCRNQKSDWNPAPASLAVGRTPPNAWGLCDMHGIVEEWCHDWFGPYENGEQADPVGRAAGTFKVTRGGSHNTDVGFLRSANRLGALPEDRHWLIGFRVVMGELPGTKPLPAPKPALCARDVGGKRIAWSQSTAEPFFAEPIPYVLIPPDQHGPLYSQHNHCPSIAWCDNGDLLAIWFSCETEGGRELTIVGSRLRSGKKEWDAPEEFFKAPDRNMTGSGLLNDGKGKLYHFNGMDAAAGWGNLALVMRTSTDNGATWSAPRLINPSHQLRNQVISGTSMTKEGCIIQPCDAVWGGEGGTAVHISCDGGQTWADPGADRDRPEYTDGGSGGTIAGIHAGVVELADGSFLAHGRGNNINGRMPRSISHDMGRTWTYSATEFPPIGGGQRLVLMRLREGPLMFVSFSDEAHGQDRDKIKGFAVRDAAGAEREIFGSFAAVSFDEGKTWPVKKPLSLGGPARTFHGRGWTREFLMDDTHAEPLGYFAATQSPDNIIHLVSSGLHYRYNLAWLKTPMPAAGK